MPRLSLIHILLGWIQDFKAPRPEHVFVVHGDREVAPFFAQTLCGLGFEAHAPQYTEVYDLAANRQIEVGYLPERKAKPFDGAPKTSSAYQSLMSVGEMLMELIRRSRGRDNKSLASFAEQLRKLIEKWDF